jgi:hypothetical protein
MSRNNVEAALIEWPKIPERTITDVRVDSPEPAKANHENFSLIKQITWRDEHGEFDGFDIWMFVICVAFPIEWIR